MNTVKVLVVEDEAITGMDIQKRLQKLGYDVPVVANSGEESIELTKKISPNLILMDIVLKGGMDGTQAAEYISKNFSIPIIFLTAYKDDATLDRAKLSNPYGYLSKPFETRDLQIALDLALFKHKKEEEILATERQLHAQELLNTELKATNITKNIFLANISHELRTPLNAIIGFTRTLLMKFPGPLNSDQEYQLNTVMTSAKHLLSLINDLLDLTKIDAGKMEIVFNEVNCSEVINEIITTLSTLATAKNLKLYAMLSEENVMIDTDRRRLIQIMINLTNNAIKFTDKGEIKIQLEKCVMNEKKYIAIHVHDTGIGIKEADQAKLFQAFQQVHSPGKQIEGTGLGLHLCQKLAELIHGEITFKSEYGKGSRFSILFSCNK